MTEESSLKELFEKYGEIISLEIFKNEESGRSKGFGRVVMADNEAIIAISELDDTTLDGRKIRVSNEDAPYKYKGGIKIP